MLLIGMLLFCVVKLILGTLLPTYNPSVQGKSTKHKQLIFSTTTNIKRLSIQTSQPTIRQKIANQCYNKTTFFTEGFPSLNESSTLKSAKSL